MRTKIVTTYYAYHAGPPFWGQNGRDRWYKYSLASICGMGCDVVCYTDDRGDGYNNLLELKENLKLDNLIIKKYDLIDNPFHERETSIRYSYPEKYNTPKIRHYYERPSQIYWMKFYFLLKEHEDDINLYWIDCGLSHMGLFPSHTSAFGNEKEFKSFYPGPDYFKNEYKLYSYNVFNPETLERINKFNKGKIINLYRDTTDSSYYEFSKILGVSPECELIYPVGGLWGGSSNLLKTHSTEAIQIIDKLLENKEYICGDEEILTYLNKIHREWFINWKFDTFYHEDWIDVFEKGSIGFYKFFTDYIQLKEEEMVRISFYGSHNAGYVVEKNGEIVMQLEIERFLNFKNSGMAQYLVPTTDSLLRLAEYIPQYIMRKLNIEEFDECLFLNTDVILYEKHELEKYIPAKKYIPCMHHESHAAGSFYQSPYRKALIFSFDGGGNDGKFNVYTCERGSKPIRLDQVLSPALNIQHVYYDLGFPYMTFGHFLEDIKHEDLSRGNLVYPGKLMGLSSYGKVRSEWIDSFTSFYKSDPNGLDYLEKIAELGEKIGVSFNPEERLTGTLAYDIAATSQRVFEDCFLEIAKPYMELYPDLPVCLTGGCGLNILLNTRLVNELNKEVFVGPDPNDCGVALGMLLNEMRPETPYDSTYSGIEILDIDTLDQYIINSRILLASQNLDMNMVVDDLLAGKIVGVARGKSEHGPRALGNRSILCNPSIPGMKDTLNAKVKHREWYRPFAPVVRLEDVSKYFEWNRESRWMSFCPTVKEEWRDKLSAITHVDNTARVQTVTREQNAWLYDLLTLFEEKTGIGVLLNTSFNVDGKPILSTVRDAFLILENTELDRLVIENCYIWKK